MMVVHSSKAAYLALLLSLKSVHAVQSIYSVQALAELSWRDDDDAASLLANELYQFENVASAYFGALLVDWFESQPRQDPLTTKVTTVDQVVTLSPTGENMEFRLSSIVDLTYIGEEEINALASTLEEVTKGHEMAAFLASSGFSSTYTMSFSDPPRDSSKLLYTVQDTSVAWHSAAQIGLIVAAGAALIMASMILLWAVGGFDRWKSCKNLRSRFYTHSPMPKSENGMKAKLTSDETEDGTGNVATHGTPGHVKEIMAPHEGGFEVSNTRDVLGLDEMDALSQGSQTRDTCNFAEGSTGLAIITCTSETKVTSNTTEDENGNVEAHLEDQHDEENLPPCQSGIEVRPRRGVRAIGSEDTETLSPGRDMPDSFSLRFGSEEMEGLSPRGNTTDLSYNISDWSNGLSIISTTSHTNDTASHSEAKSPESIMADLFTCAWQRGPATDLDASTDGSSVSSLRDHG